MEGTAKVVYKLPAPVEAVESIMMAKYAQLAQNFANDSKTVERIRYVSQWLTDTNKSHSLLLMGRVGNGKTTMLQCVVRTCEALRMYGESKKGEFWRLTSNLPENVTQRSQLKQYQAWANMRKPAVYSANQFIEAWSGGKYLGADILCIDDLGSEPVSVKVYGTDRTPLADVICDRYDRGLPTIICTNLNDDEICQIYGKRIADRLRDYNSLVYEELSYRGK